MSSNSLNHLFKSASGSGAGNTHLRMKKFLKEDQDPSLSMPLPPNHFLSQPPSETTPSLTQRVPPIMEGYFLNNSTLTTTTSSNPTPGLPDISSLAAADFDIDVRSGFLPPSPPIQSLSHLPTSTRWPGWEELLERARAECFLPDDRTFEEAEKSRRWREDLEKMPSDTEVEMLANELPLLRRAYQVFAFLQHYYVHSKEANEDLNEQGKKILIVPSCLSKPFWNICSKLGLPPILTYAATVLWNWKLIDPSMGDQLANYTTTTCFTPAPSTSEAWFYLTSLHSELLSPHILSHMRMSLSEAFVADELSISRIALHLTEIAHLIREMTDRVGEGVNKVDAGEFYGKIRKWFNGGRWKFEGVGVGNSDVEIDLGGPSAGQSSLVHALDLFLGIDHSPRASPILSATSISKGTSALTSHDQTFMSRMSSYMPHHHRQFLLHLSSTQTPSPFHSPTIRELAQSAQEDSEIRMAYDDAVNAMKAFRDEHMRIVAKFIISPARKEMAKAGGGREPELKGTGGTDLVRFLKSCRERTSEALLDN